MASSRARSKSFGSSHDLVMEGWEAKENRDGIVYFVHNQIKITSWIHPYVNKVFEELGNYNDIKYAAYRTAMKMRFLQVKLGFSWISIEGVKKVFSNIPVTEDCSGIEDLFSCREAFSVVHRVLEMSDSLRLHRNHLVHASEVILNLLLEIYDTTRSGKLAKRSVRIALVALCSAKLSDKYRFFFNEISNVRGHIQREKFLFFVYDLMQITELLKESTAFGTNVSAAVNSCLNGSGDHSPSESSQETFYSWLLQEPQTLIWLPTLHRVIATENVQHNIQCSVCNTQPLIGFRYRCMQCFSYDLCQSCFFRGCISLSHRSKHPMQEYCLPTTRKDNTKALLKIVRNKVSKRHRQSKIKFLPVDDDSITGSVFQWQPRSLVPDPRGSFHSSIDSGLAVCSSSGNGEFQVMGPADQMDANDIAMMKKWCKPVEVLGEPYDASSPCLQQETLSKKNMEGQQRKMSQTIQQLQEENRILRQKLSSLRKREIEDDEEKFNLLEETVNVVLEDKNYSGDPLKEITTDEPISPIKSVSVTDGLSTTVDPFRADKEYGLKEQDISINVLNIVGSCTPIATSLHVENKESTDSNESGINEDGGAYSDDLSISSSKLTRNRVEEDDNFEMEKCEIHNSEPLIKQPVFALQIYTDTETESTTSNDLEYTLSDMSLMSEAPSRARSTRSEQVGLKVLAWPVDKVKVAEEDVSKMDRITTNDATTDYCNNTSAYTYITPNTTKNETTELDAFKLCRMKFDGTDGPCKKFDRQDSSSSGSQPRLIYTSSSKRNKHPLRNGHHKHPLRNGHHNFRAEPCQVDKIAIVNETNRTQSQLHASNYASFDLSEIPAQGSTAFFSNDTKRSSQPRDSGARKTPEPVFMSTPVTNDAHFVPWKSALRKKSASVKVNRKRQEKENRAPSFGGNSIVEPVLYTEKELSVYSATPKSSIPSWQRQRILRTMDRLQSNRSYSCNDLTTGGEMGMTTMFANAEHCRTLGEGCNSLPLEDKEELDRMIDRINIEDSQRSDLPVGHDASNSSMLQAVLNIGDAMADFVQATAEVQMQKESNHF